MRPRSAGATWQGWERRDRNRRVARAIAAWILLIALAWLTAIGFFTVVGFVIALFG